MLKHYHISNIAITAAMVEKARYLPDDSILDKLNSKEFRGLGLDYQWDNEEELIGTAEKVLHGIVPGLPYKISMPFNADDVNRGLPGEQVRLAGFFIPNLLLDAYEVTGREEFLTTARDVILAWALYERQIWLPRGLIWNDYAIAGRILTLSKFWAIYRNHRTYQPEVAKTILQFVARCGKFLSEPSHFTFSTNHGIIQNLGLLHLCLAFPTLPGIEQYKQLALSRIHNQMPFYINDEGAVLEHSAHYQSFGIRLIGKLFRYLTLMNLPIPQNWKERYEKAIYFYTQIRRPDGSLPMYGDTGSERSSLGPLMATVDDNGRCGGLNYRENLIPKHSHSLLPVAGYSVWWDGLHEWPGEKKMNQTVVIWSYFPGHAHKHADEMSVLLWSNGQQWWTNAGYWEYGVKGRSEAESWSGSNAPHLIGEDTHSIRRTKLLFYMWSNDTSVIDLERRGPLEYIARRQIIHLKPNLWIVVDDTSGDNHSRTTTTWTTSHNVKMDEGEMPNSYILKGENNNKSLTTFIITSEDTKIRRYRGSFTPFAGWELNKPADSIVIEQPANNSWSVAIWSLENAAGPALQFTETPYMQDWKNPVKWRLILPVKTGLFSIWRDGDSIYVNEGTANEASKEIKLIEAPSIEDKYEKIRADFANTAKKYPIFKDYLSRRWKMTYLLILIFVMQEIFFLIYKKVKGKHYDSLRMLTIIGWVSIIIVWIVFLHYRA